MKTSIAVSQSVYVGDRRLDASFHTSYGIQAKNHLKEWSRKYNGKIDRLSDVANLFNGPRFPRFYVKDFERGIPFLSSSDMLQADLTDIKRLSLQRTPKALLQSIEIKQGWTLISCSGTIGNCVYVRQDMDGMTGSQHIMRVAPTSNIPPGYLFTFLSGDTGYNLLTQGTYGAVIQHIEPHHIKNLPIPRLNATTEERIHQLIERSANLWVQASEYLKQAQKPFGFIDNKEVLFFSPHDFDLSIIKASDLNDRLGGYYHSKIYRNIEQKIRSGRHKELRELSTRIFAPPLFKHIYLNNPNQYPFLTGGELANRQFTDIKYLSTKGVKNINDYVVKDGWVAVYRHGQYESMLGTSFLIDKRLDNFCLSDLVIRVVLDKSIISPEYVFAFLSTKAGKLLIKRLATGRSIPFVTEKSLATLPIPILDNMTIESISNLVRSAYDLRMQSLQLEDEAKRILNDELSIK